MVCIVNHVFQLENIVLQVMLAKQCFAIVYLGFAESKRQNLILPGEKPCFTPAKQLYTPAKPFFIPLKPFFLRLQNPVLRPQNPVLRPQTNVLRPENNVLP